ncbi:phasin family protein [Paracraurococcus lichenis]|uniref:Phasin family protein n=1 Tax=Paracraurococcus lichenis TaxID=3064888 RepID=A0ABT9DUS6_9PROT|nr:phasin family protein [Paracraurococcus sp. LOR1-02]MDO9707628.1 phasin family protein [Paracraurococcus sp. LOR1-02]
MDGEQPPGSGFRPLPLVPPPRGEGPEDLLALQRRGIEMITAAHRLAVTWLQAAAQQHAQVTRRTLDEMTENARRLAGASAPPETAAAVLDMVDRAQALGLQTAREIAELMQRMQGDTVQLVDQVLRGGKDEG